jgi:1,2-diacylglycerol 3-beta-glucosyltransferase
MAQLADFLNVLSAGLLLFGGAIVLSYWFLAAVAAVTRRPRESGEPRSYHSFAIVIPAHNEEEGLAATLRSCQALTYPRHLVSVHVVADNCSDGTTRVAREHGVHCLVREDKEKRGKGYALAFAFQQLMPHTHDAVLVLDADCVLDPAALTTFNQHLLAGHKALQGNYVASNPDESAISYVLAAGNAIENDLFYVPLSRLGVSALLRGTGMVLHREILDQHPWTAFSVAEDVEYSLTLARHGIPVRYAETILVRSPFPQDCAQLETQRRRWATGNVGLARKHALGLIWEGLRIRRRTLVEAGWTLFLLSRPLVMLLLLLPALLLGASVVIEPAPVALALFGFSLALLGSLIAYFALGAVRLGITSHRLRLLLQAPVVVGRLAAIAVLGLAGMPRYGWDRTPR